MANYSLPLELETQRQEQQLRCLSSQLVQA